MFILDLTTRAVGQEDLMTRLARQAGQLPQAPTLSHSAVNPDQFGGVQIDPMLLDNMHQQLHIRTIQQQQRNEFTELASSRQPRTISPLDAEIERLQRRLRNEGSNLTREALAPDNPRRNTRDLMSFPTAVTAAAAFQHATSCPNIGAYAAQIHGYNTAINEAWGTTNVLDAEGRAIPTRTPPTAEKLAQIAKDHPVAANPSWRTRIGYWLTTEPVPAPPTTTVPPTTAPPTTATPSWRTRIRNWFTRTPVPAAPPTPTTAPPTTATPPTTTTTAVKAPLRPLNTTGKVLTLNGYANTACFGLTAWNVGKMFYNAYNYNPALTNQGNSNGENVFANYLRGQTEGSRDKLVKAAWINAICTYGIGTLIGSRIGMIAGHGIGNIIGNIVVNAYSSTNSFVSKVAGWFGL